VYLYGGIDPVSIVKRFLEELDAILKKHKWIKEEHIEMYMMKHGLEGKRHTLQEIGNVYGITRERVRQIIERIHSRCKNQITDISVDAFLKILMMNKFNRIFVFNKKLVLLNLLKFAAELLGIYLNFIEDQILILSTLAKKEIKSISDIIPSESGQLEPGKIPMKINEIELLRGNEKERMKLSEKVYACLKEIGRPAHYSEIADKYRQLFPRENITDRKIHSVLNRNDLKDKLWVWVGTHGCYALKEWGYERPKDTVFDLAYRVVSKIYEQTKKPVKFEVAYAEALNERNPLKKATFFHACIHNYRLERVEYNKFIPIKGTKLQNKHIPKKTIYTIS
jgi:hypothetical protein